MHRALIAILLLASCNKHEAPTTPQRLALTLDQRKVIFWDLTQAVFEVELECYHKFGKNLTVDRKSRDAFFRERLAARMKALSAAKGLSNEEIEGIFEEGRAAKWPNPIDKAIDDKQKQRANTNNLK